MAYTGILGLSSPGDLALTGLDQGSTTARLSKIDLEALRQGPGNARLSKVDLEVLRQGPGNARLSKLDAEVLRQGPGNVRLTKISVDVLRSPTSNYDNSVSFSSTNTLTFTVLATFNASNTFSSTNTLSFTIITTFNVTDLTFSSTNTLTLTPNNVITVADTFSSTAGYSADVAATFNASNTFTATNTFTLTPNNVVSLTESFSETATYSTDVLATFETSDTFSGTNTFTLTPNNVLNVSYSDSETANFILTPNNNINSTYSDSESADFILTPNNNIGTDFDLDSTGEFNEDTEADDEVELNIFSVNTFAVIPANTLNLAITFIEVNSIVLDYEYIPGSHTPTTFNDTVTLLRESDLSAAIAATFNAKVEFREDFDLPGDIEPQFATIGLSGTVDYVFSLNLSVISIAVFTPNLVIDTSISLTETTSLMFAAITNIFKSIQLDTISSFSPTSKLILDLKLRFITPEGTDIDIFFDSQSDSVTSVKYVSNSNYSNIPNLVIGTTSQLSSASTLTFSGLVGIYKTVEFDVSPSVSSTNTVDYKSTLNLARSASVSLIPNKVIDITPIQFQVSNRISTTIITIFATPVSYGSTSSLITNATNKVNTGLNLAATTGDDYVLDILWGLNIVFTDSNSYVTFNTLDAIALAELEQEPVSILTSVALTLSKTVLVSGTSSLSTKPFVTTSKSISFSESATYQVVLNTLFKDRLPFEASSSISFLLTQGTSALSFNQTGQYQNVVEVISIPVIQFNNDSNAYFFGQNLSHNEILMAPSTAFLAQLNTDFHPMTVLALESEIESDTITVFEATLGLGSRAVFYSQMSKSTDQGAWFFHNIVRKG